MKRKRFLSNTTFLALGCMAIVTLDACAQRTAKTNATPETTWEFTLPDVPAMLTDPASRAEFLVTHYWDRFEFADTTRIADTARIEQAFVDYIVLFPHTTREVASASIGRTLEKALAAQPVFDRFTGLYEKYLYDANSPFRDEESYLLVLEQIIANTEIDDTRKIRPAFQLEQVKKNRLGTVAADFTYTLANGKTATLRGIRAEYTLLFFYDPGCTDCARTKSMLEQSGITLPLIESGKLKVLAMYPEESLEEWKAYQPEISTKWINARDASPEYDVKNKLYAVRALPSLYLLDKDKRVLLRDATAEQTLETLVAMGL